jgi:hypothetical protein
MMLFLSWSDSLTPELPFFMLDVHEVIDSPVESPNVLAHGSNKSWKLLLKIVKSDTPIWQTGGLGFIGSDSSQAHRQLRIGHPSSGQVASNLRKNKNHDEPMGLKWRLQHLIDEKKENRKN